MSDFDSNPFADPDFSNPFQVTLTALATLTLAAVSFYIKTAWLGKTGMGLV